MRRAEAVLFVTPEYNRSVPGVLKNAIDVGSRPYGKSVWEGKPAAVVSVSPGALGGFGANHHLRQSLVFLNMPAMQQPEAYIGHAAELVDDNDDVTVEATKKFLANFMEAFEAWIERTGEGVISRGALQATGTAAPDAQPGTSRWHESRRSPPAQDAASSGRRVCRPRLSGRRRAQDRPKRRRPRQ